MSALHDVATPQICLRIAVAADKLQLEGIQVIQVPPLIISSTETPGSITALM